MKAMQIQAYGSADQLQLEAAPMPVCGPQQVLVRLVTAGINPIDWKFRSGELAQMMPRAFPFTPGADGAGVVTAVGTEVQGYATGDEVLFYADFGNTGTYAEYIAVDAAQLAHKPPSVSFVTAAALPVAGQSAWSALMDVAQIRPGMRILIHGAAGAVGSIALQLAKRHGLYVIATASGAGMDRVRALGADQVIDYRSQRFEEMVRDVDVVLDTQGGAIQDASWATLKPGGLLIATTQPPSPERAAAAGVRAQFLFTHSRGEVLQQLVKLVADGRLQVHVAREFALADAARAHQLGERGEAGGKMVLHVGAPAL